MQECSKGSIGCGWSEIMYLSAVTTVLLTKAEGEERCSYQDKIREQVVTHTVQRRIKLINYVLCVES